jgi:hypothetical protein
MDTLFEQRSCKRCALPFEVFEEDLTFYKKFEVLLIAPAVGSGERWRTLISSIYTNETAKRPASRLFRTIRSNVTAEYSVKNIGGAMTGRKLLCEECFSECLD